MNRTLNDTKPELRSEQHKFHSVRIGESLDRLLNSNVNCRRYSEDACMYTELRTERQLLLAVLVSNCAARSEWHCDLCAEEHFGFAVELSVRIDTLHTH